MAITKQDKMVFGEFARFYKGPEIGANNSDKQPLGLLLQSHVAIVQSLAKVPLTGLMFPDMEHDEPYMAHVPPGQTGEIVWTFNRAGRFEFACLIAGHYQGGMKGIIDVEKT